MQPGKRNVIDPCRSGRSNVRLGKKLHMRSYIFLGNPCCHVNSLSIDATSWLTTTWCLAAEKLCRSIELSRLMINGSRCDSRTQLTLVKYSLLLHEFALLSSQRPVSGLHLLYRRWSARDEPARRARRAIYRVHYPANYLPLLCLLKSCLSYPFHFNDPKAKAAESKVPQPTTTTMISVTSATDGTQGWEKLCIRIDSLLAYTCPKFLNCFLMTTSARWGWQAVFQGHP